MASLEIPGVTSKEEEVCPSLTFKQRMIGCGICSVIGVILSIISWVLVFQKNYVGFGITFTCANIITIGGTMFLAGPKSQCQKMFDETRRWATVVYLLMMVLTLVMALAVKIGALVIVCCVLQLLAAAYYALTYIPGGRTVLQKLACGF